MGGRSRSNTSSYSNVTNTDRRVVADGNGIGISAGDNAIIELDQVPEEVLDASINAVTGAYELVSKSLDVASLTTANAVASVTSGEVENPAASSLSRDNRLLIAVAIMGAAYIAAKKL